MTVVHKFITSYNSKKELLNYIKTSEFFYNIEKTLQPGTYKFEPKIEENLFSKKYIKWPQKLRYTEQINILAFSLPEIEVEQEYRLVYDQLQCKIRVYTGNMGTIILNSKMDIEEKDNKTEITLTCEEPEGYFIPEIMMTFLIGQLDETLKKLF